MKFLRKASCLAVLMASGTDGMTTAESVARNWMMTHQPSSQDELAELKAANPSAYAIVSALLTKQRMGILDPRHPSASFSAPQHHEEYSPNVFKQFESPQPKLAAVSEGDDVSSTSEISVPAAPQQHDWLNWKPHSGAMDDESIVKDVIGGDLPPSPKSAAPSQGFLAPALPAVQAKVGAAPAGNPYFADLGSANEQRSQSAPQMSAISKTQEDSADASPLSSFSWGDVDPDQKASSPQPATVALPQQQQQVQKAKSPLLAWLGGGKAQQADQQSVQQAPAAEQNSYMADLS